MARGPRLTIGRWAARSSSHPELGGRRLEVIVGPRGGVVGFRGTGGDLAGRTFSARVIERIFRAGHPRSERSFTYVMTPAAYDQAVAEYLLRHPGASRGQARIAVHEAESYIYRARTKAGRRAQTIQGRTRALRVLGVLDMDEVSGGKYAVRFSNPEARIELLGVA